MKKAHHKLLAWQLGLELVEQVYQTTSAFPDSERYGLSSQMRRAAISVPANIAEGAARSSDREFQRFLVIARASLMELETFLLLARRLEYVADTNHLHLQLNRVYGLVNGLIRQVKNKPVSMNTANRIGEQSAGYSPLTSYVSPVVHRNSNPSPNLEAQP